MDEITRNRRVDQALLPTVASLGAWGVESAHWLPDRTGEPVVWLRTRTEAQSSTLQKAIWLTPQVQHVLTRLGVPHDTVWGLRLELTSLEAEKRLLSD